MISNIEKYVESFNDGNIGFGTIDMTLFDESDEDYQVLLYLYPMIERLFRNILDQEGIFDLENSDSSTFKTLNSIVNQNKPQILEVLGEEFGDELIFYLEEIYSESGLRNMVLHYHKTFEFDKSDTIAAKYIFQRLIVFYVDRYCGGIES